MVVHNAKDKIYLKEEGVKERRAPRFINSIIKKRRIGDGISKKETSDF